MSSLSQHENTRGEAVQQRVAADEADASDGASPLNSTDLDRWEQTRTMANEFTAVVERDGEWFIAYCAEIPGANGQGHTKEEALESLSAGVALILEDRREDALRGLPADAIKEKVTIK